MSGKTDKKLRRLVRENYTEKALLLQQQAVDSWISNLLKSPLKNRIRAALKIIKGAK